MQVILKVIMIMMMLMIMMITDDHDDANDHDDADGQPEDQEEVGQDQGSSLGKPAFLSSSLGFPVWK